MLAVTRDHKLIIGTAFLQGIMKKDAVILIIICKKNESDCGMCVWHSTNVQRNVLSRQNQKLILPKGFLLLILFLFFEVSAQKKIVLKSFHVFIKLLGAAIQVPDGRFKIFSGLLIVK